MKHIRIIIIAVCLYHNIGISAQQVSPTVANQVAENFMNSLLNDISYIPPQIPSAGNNSQIYLDTTIAMGGSLQNPAMYLVLKNGNWVLVAGDNRVTPILAYSDYTNANNYSEDDIPPAAQELFDWYESQIMYVRDSTNNLNMDTTWNIYQSSTTGISPTVIVAPLLQRNGIEIRWDQSDNADRNSISSKSYNKFCPPSNSCENTLVGCVAVAMGQLMWYWKWPYAILTRDENNTPIIREYDWDMMPQALYNSTSLDSVDMVAHLLRDVGRHVDMDYGCAGSGASIDNIRPALTSTFNYDAIGPLSREPDAENDGWLRFLKRELNNECPVLYGGRNYLDEGHRFVIDGYESDNYFHVNIGWGMTYPGSGYYRLDHIIEGCGSSDLYVYEQTAFSAQPVGLECTPTTYTTNTTWPSNFIVQHRGAVIIENRIVNSSQKGVIFSGDYIRLGDGVHLQSGSNVHLVVKDLPCAELNSPTPNNAPVRRYGSIPSTNNSDQEAIDLACRIFISHNTIEHTIKINSLEDVLSVNIYSISGQLVQTCSRPNMDISFLSSGVYIVTAQTSTGEKVQEKIAVY